MRTIVTETIAYKFDELSKDSQEKAIENNRDANVTHDWWDCIYYDFKENNNEYFYIDRIYFSGFWSQGDGAMFEYSSVKGQLISDFLLTLDLSPMRKAWLNNNAYFYGKGKQIGHYYHEKSCSHSIGVEVDNGDILYGTNFRGWIESFDYEFEKFVIDKYESMCCNLYSTLSKEYDYLTSDEVIKEYLIENDYEFDINGNII
jgi:hypothetical protein